MHAVTSGREFVPPTPHAVSRSHVWTHSRRWNEALDILAQIKASEQTQEGADGLGPCRLPVLCWDLEVRQAHWRAPHTVGQELRSGRKLAGKPC